MNNDTNNTNVTNPIISDELSKIQIDQLHKTVLNMSNQSFETKKICIVTLTTALTAIISFNTLSLTFTPYIILGVTMLFYITDTLLYYYQRSLRRKMIEEENSIYFRHNITSSNKPITPRPLPENSILRAFFNLSHMMYYLLIIISIIFFHF